MALLTALPRRLRTLTGVLTMILALASLVPPPAGAGGTLETLDITARKPGPGSGEIIARVVPVRLDPRCIPLPFSLNTTLDPIPNPLAEDFLTLEELTPVLKESLAAWTEISTSFVDLRLEGTTTNPGTQRFDTIPEITFRTPPGQDFFASSVSTCLIEDQQLTAGTDLDGDGDSDVTEGIERCRDTDGDGDIELPAGFYKAGTVLDTDVQFNARRYRFTIGEEAVDTNRDSVDLKAVATHEFGHSQGLAHSLSNQLSDSDGTQAVMFPFIDNGDPADQLAVQSPRVEDVATSSFFYPEGTSLQGPAALQPGDVPFHRAFTVLEGDAIHGVQNLPLAGGSVFAVAVAHDEVWGSTITGTVRLVLDVERGTTSSFPPGATPEIVDGRWALPLPFGFYRLGIEAVDGAPVSADVVNLTTGAGSRSGQARFLEEFFNGDKESAVEVRPGFGVLVPALPSGLAGSLPDLRLITNQVVDLGSGAGRRNEFREVLPGDFLAVRFPAELIRSATGDEKFAAVAARFNTVLADRSTVPLFEQALLVSGTVDEVTGIAQLDLGFPLARSKPFIGQDNDDAPWYFAFPRLLGELLRQKIDRGEIQDVFLVLEGPKEPLPGVSQRGPFLGIDEAAPFAGRSFSSTDGVIFRREEGADFLFGLLLSSLP